MRLGDLTLAEVNNLAQGSGLRYWTGSFSVCLRSDIPGFLRLVTTFYASAELYPGGDPVHFHVDVHRVGAMRRWFRPQVQFTVDGVQPFDPYPLDHAFPMFEWGLNWCIATTAHHNLMLHSAVVEKAGRGLILPAMPGSGKSTLCAGLVSRGWRLLSDEFGIIRHSDGMLLPLPRAAPLKNESIDIIENFAPDLMLGPRFHKTRKGTVAHVAPPADSLRRQDEAVRPRWVIFPRFQAGASTTIKKQPRPMALTRLVNNSFNYPVTMDAGFRTLIGVVRNVDCYELLNGDIEEAVTVIEDLLQGDLT